MINPLNELSSVYMQNISEKKKCDEKLPQGDSVDGGDTAKPGKDKNYVKPMATEEKEESKIGGGNLKKLASKANKRIDADVDGDVDTDDPKSSEMGEFVSSPDGKKKIKTKARFESTYSNWRNDSQELLEVISGANGLGSGVEDDEKNLETPKAKTDNKSNQRITEKNVKNKIKINPPQGMVEAFGELGGVITEMYEIVEEGVLSGVVSTLRSKNGMKDITSKGKDKIQDKKEKSVCESEKKPSAFDIVKKQIKDKYGEQSLIDTKLKKKELSPEEKKKEAQRRSKNYADNNKNYNPYKARAGESD